MTREPLVKNICKIMIDDAQDLINIQTTAFRNGIYWFGAYDRVYSEKVACIVIKLYILGYNDCEPKLFMTQCDKKSVCCGIDAKIMEYDYFMQNARTLAKKYMG